MYKINSFIVSDSTAAHHGATGHKKQEEFKIQEEEEAEQWGRRGWGWVYGGMSHLHRQIRETCVQTWENLRGFGREFRIKELAFFQLISWHLKWIVIYLSIYLSFVRSFYLMFYRSVLSVSFCLSVCRSICCSIVESVMNAVSCCFSYSVS